MTLLQRTIANDTSGPVVSRGNNFAALREQILQKDGPAAKEVAVIGNDYVRLFMNPPLGRGYVDFIQLAPDFLVSVADCDFLDDQHFKYFGENWVKFNFRLSGASIIGFDGHQREELGGRTSHVFAQPKGLMQRDSFMRGEASRWVSILCKRKRLTENLGVDIERLPTKLANFLDGSEKEGYFKSANLSCSSEMLVRELMKSPDKLALRPLYVKSKIYSLLYAFLNETFCMSDRSSQHGKLSRRDIVKLEESKFILEEDMLNSLNMHGLARKVGLNRNKLSYGFRDHFGLTIFEFCKQTRLSKAREMLVNTNMSNVQIADAVGYTHASSLTVAVKAHFGFTPIQIRNGSRN
jgi:AraC-like DNA-binding protein